MKDALIILFKNPLPGKVKTRIAKDLGDTKALEVYHKLLSHTLSITKELPVKKYLYYGFFIDEKDQWESEVYQKRLQVPGDLGDRMYIAFQEVLLNHDRVVIIGSDCIELSSKILLEAFDSLKKNDFVIGPTFDGGYYLLGMNAFRPEVLQDISWSSEKVYTQTISKIESLGLSFASLRKLHDVDYIEDCERFNLL